MIYRVAVIGSGPAGLTAGIYTSRAQLTTAVIEGALPGGQLMLTTKVENWPGNISIVGPELMDNLKNHAQACGCKMITGSVVSVDFGVHPFILTLDGGQKVQAESVIVATGSSHKKLGCPGEDTYWGNGVSVCATCDAPFFKDKDVVVIGGGNSAVTEAAHLAHVAKKVTVVQARDQLTATDPIKFNILNNPKIFLVYNAAVKEIKGDGSSVTGVVVENQKNKTLTEIPASGVFVAIGMKPNTDFLKTVLKIDSYGYLIMNGRTQTNVKGVFAAGEVADFNYRQAITSAAGGCMAALDCQAYLAQKEIEFKKV